MSLDCFKHVRMDEEQLRAKLTAVGPVFSLSSKFIKGSRTPPPLPVRHSNPEAPLLGVSLERDFYSVTESVYGHYIIVITTRLNGSHTIYFEDLTRDLMTAQSVSSTLPAEG